MSKRYTGVDAIEEIKRRLSELADLVGEQVQNAGGQDGSERAPGGFVSKQQTFKIETSAGPVDCIASCEVRMGGVDDWLTSKADQKPDAEPNPDGQPTGQQPGQKD